MIEHVIFALIFGVICGGGALFIYLGVPHGLTLNEFYGRHELRAFSDTLNVSDEAWWTRFKFILALIDRFRGVGENRQFTEFLIKIKDLIEVANLPITPGTWLAQALVWVGGGVVAAIAGYAVTGMSLMIVLPFLIGYMMYARLVRAARVRRDRIRRQLPVLLSLMSASADILPTLDGANGVLAWVVRTMRGDATNLFRSLIIEADAQNLHIEDVFDKASIRLKIPELSTLAQVFRIYHAQGMGLTGTFKQMAKQWTEEQNRLIDSNMRKKGFVVQIMVLIFYVPTIIALLLAPAVFHVAQTLKL